MKMVRLGSVGLILISASVHVNLVSGLVKDVEILSTRGIVYAKNGTAISLTCKINVIGSIQFIRFIPDENMHHLLKLNVTMNSEECTSSINITFSCDLKHKVFVITLSPTQYDFGQTWTCSAYVDQQYTNISDNVTVCLEKDTINNSTGLEKINNPGVDKDVGKPSTLKTLKYSLIDMLIVGFVCITTTAMFTLSLTVLYFRYVNKQEDAQENKRRSYEDVHSASSATYDNIN